MIRSQKKLSETVTPQEQLSSSEELLVKYQKTSDWVRSNTRLVYGGGAVVLLIVAGFFFWRSKAAENNERAETLLARISGYYTGSEWRTAIDGNAKQRFGSEPLIGLKAIAAEYGS